MPGQRLLLIIENPKERMTYTTLFEGMGFLVDSVPDGASAMAYLGENKPDLVVADDGTPEFMALDFLKEAARVHPGCKTIIITPEPVVDYAVSLMKHGAMDYLIKPVDPRQLELSVRKSLTLFHSPDREKKEGKKKKPVQIITKDARMRQLLTLATRVADSSASVLIQGESGTGKELFARFLHEKSGRAGHPFIAVNCAALPENLLESELFGHEKGAFTGALSRKMGKFEQAHRGTLFLDEITEMQFHLQAKLLRVLQEKVVDRVGGTQAVDVDVRVIASTNRDARDAVEQKEFREDLFYRLNTIPLVIPPLRERTGDVDLLSGFFIKKYCRIDGRSVKGLTPEATGHLAAHGFPGNVRELENIIHRAVLLAQTDEIAPGDLLMEGVDPGVQPGIQPGIQPDATLGHVPAPEGGAPGNAMEEAAQAHPISQAQPIGQAHAISSLKEMEQQMIFKTLDQTEGNRTHAAKILGISVRTLRNKLNEYKAQS